MKTRTQPSKQKTVQSVERAGPLLIDVACIERNPDNPREDFDDAELQALAASMDSMTLMQPVTLQRCPGDSERFRLIAGERRWRAAQLAGWKSVQAYVVKAPRSVAVEMMVMENLQRAELNPIEKARAVELLTRPAGNGGAGKSQAEVARLMGKDPSWVANLLRVLKLPDDWKTRIAQGDINLREARALASYADRPDVLAAVQADRKSNPEDWRTSEQFEQQLCFVAGRLDGLTEADAGESFPGESFPEDAAAVLPLARRSAPVDHSAPDAAEQVLALVAVIDDREALALIRQAVDARWEQLKPKARKGR